MPTSSEHLMETRSRVAKAVPPRPSSLPLASSSTTNVAKLANNATLSDRTTRLVSEEQSPSQPEHQYLPKQSPLQDAGQPSTAVFLQMLERQQTAIDALTRQLSALNSHDRTILEPHQVESREDVAPPPETSAMMDDVQHYPPHT
ncbi:hypothetical protein BWQ96_03774 [Gracilariopsis chorda]|uniref:Uncharacterized protein n=1 Tax=Gracilariopsis chorda TaxID=448386 RepID=A0A2V3IWI5_9FLOR|nr:hypothetical protein BWQ96_03774 [Gracilariopsis chorda]|eukprot:PXF46449.1 hypothetical protein BWQ96_03774 [Gracilariopsis chorda]